MRTALIAAAALLLGACSLKPADEPTQVEARWDTQADSLRCYPRPYTSSGPNVSGLPPTVDPVTGFPVYHVQCEWSCATYQGVSGQHVTLTFAFALPWSAWPPAPSCVTDYCFDCPESGCPSLPAPWACANGECRWPSPWSCPTSDPNSCIWIGPTWILEDELVSGGCQ